MSIYNPKQQKNIVFVVIVFLGLFLLYALKDFLTALLGAIIFYTLFKPFYKYLTEKKNIYKGLSAVVIIFISFMIIILPFFFLSWMIVDRIIEFNSNTEEINHFLNAINAFSGEKFNEPNLVRNTIQGIEKWTLDAFPTAVTGLFGVFLRITLMYFILYFMFVQDSEFESAMLKYAPFGNDGNTRLAEELKNITYSNVLGHGLIAITQGLLVAIGFWIFDINDPLFWGVISTFLAFLPIVGTPLVFVPAGILELALGHSFSGIGILVWGFILVINIDNFMRLFIAKKIANIHPLITVIGIVAGVPIFGILGLVFGPLLLSYFILMVYIYEMKNNSNQIGKKF